MNHKRTVYILASDELSKEIIKCIQRVFSFIFKVDFGLRQAGMNGHRSCEDLTGYLCFLSFSSPLLNVDKNNSNTSQDNLQNKTHAKYSFIYLLNKYLLSTFYISNIIRCFGIQQLASRQTSLSFFHLSPNVQ